MQQVFVPDLMYPYLWMSLCTVIGLAGLAVAIAAFRKANFPVRPASQLVGMLLALVGLAGGLMILWDIVRTPTIVVTPTYLLLGNDTLKVADIEKAYIEPVSDANAVGSQSVRDLGIVVLKDGTSKLFTDKHYRVKELIGAVRTHLEVR